jgi:hypothetical protein
MSDAQKTRLADQITWVWYYLNESRRFFSFRPDRGRPHWLFFVLLLCGGTFMVCVALLFFYFFPPFEDSCVPLFALFVDEVTCSTFTFFLSYAMFAVMVIGGGVSVLVVIVLEALLFVLLCSLLLGISEFVVRRIAEYPKGPVLALSALTGGISGLLKLFT